MSERSGIADRWWATRSWVKRQRAEREPLLASVVLDRFPDAVRATRGWGLAMALLVLVLGLTADDLHLLRWPGYLVGAGAAVLVLAFGGLVQGWRLAQRARELDDAEAKARFRSVRTRGHVLAVLATLGLLFWLVLFSQGVPPWAL